MKVSGSIQRWMTLAALVAVATSVGGAGLFVGRSVRERIVAEAEGSLESVLRLGSTRLCAEARQVKFSGDEFLEDRRLGSMEHFTWLVEGLPRGAKPSEDSAFQVFARTEGFPFAELDALFVGGEPEAEPGVEFAVRQGADGERYRVARLVTTPSDERPGPPDDRLDDGPQRGPRDDDRARPGPGFDRGGPGRDQGRPDPRGARGRPMVGPRFAPDERFRVLVATSIREEEAILASLFRTLLLAGALAVGLSALVIPWTVRRGLRPLRHISREIGLVDEDRLDRALDVATVPAELEPIVTSFEAVRERLATAFVREKRFTSDAAHELRTPLAGLRASMEVAMRRERTSEQYRSTIDECLGITESMQGMVDSLLLLAKGASRELETAPMDAQVILRRAFAAHADALGARRLTVQWGDVADPIVTCNEVLAERIFGNVAANAVQYATPETVIVVAFVGTATALQVLVSNRADSLAHDTAEKAFEPLWRGDAARTDASLHAGLGLSIVEQCVEALDGSVAVQTVDDRFELSLWLPR